MKKIIAAGLVGLCLWAAGLSLAEHSIQKSIAGHVIRVHVVAHSDSAYDQAEKLTVRDAVLEEMEGLLAGAKDIETARALTEKNLSDIENAAMTATDKKVTATLGERELPETAYGGYTFPGGKYEALTVTIGEGKGKNFWCVLFPPLCLFEDSALATDEETLKKYFSEEELSALKEGEVRVKLGWKLWEWMEGLFKTR